MSLGTFLDPDSLNLFFFFFYYYHFNIRVEVSINFFFVFLSCYLLFLLKLSCISLVYLLLLGFPPFLLLSWSSKPFPAVILLRFPYATSHTCQASRLILRLRLRLLLPVSCYVLIYTRAFHLFRPLLQRAFMSSYSESSSDSSSSSNPADTNRQN